MGRNVFDYHDEKMRGNAEYKAAYDALEPEFSIADALIRARVKAGLTQAEVAVRLGVTKPAVARMESGMNGLCPGPVSKNSGHGAREKLAPFLSLAAGRAIPNKEEV